jgi:hypothetical protein
MNRKSSVAILISGLAIIAVWLYVSTRGAPRTTTTTTVIKLVGTQGLMFKGTIKTNGVEVAVSGTLPTEFTLLGRSVDCSFQKTQPEGDLSIHVVSSDTGSRESWASGSASTSRAEGGVRVHVQKGGTRNEFDVRAY